MDAVLQTGLVQSYSWVFVLLTVLLFAVPTLECLTLLPQFKIQVTSVTLFTYLPFLEIF